MADNEKNLKRKERKPSDDDMEEDSDGDDNIVNVDFEFFNPAPVDKQGFVSLLRQTFSDTEDIDLNSLADLFIAQSHIGSTVKVDGDEESDPYAVFTVLSFKTHKDEESLKQLTKYLLQKISKQAENHSKLSSVLNDQSKHVGYLFSERLINMPPQIVPPLFKLLLDELQATNYGEAFDFDYFLFVSKTYREDEPETFEENEENPSYRKKRKGKSKTAIPMTLFFQAEDEIIQKYASFSCDYRLSTNSDTAVADSRRTFQDFGIEPARRILLVQKSDMPKIVSELEVLLK
ncbi:Mss4p nuclear export [Nowakowskiella sp. JEL0078]|nr:Mss4p nuclear export [Nowakowskiella sp. JEL0078]